MKNSFHLTNFLTKIFKFWKICCVIPFQLISQNFGIIFRKYLIKIFLLIFIFVTIPEERCHPPEMIKKFKYSLKILNKILSVYYEYLHFMIWLLKNFHMRAEMFLKLAVNKKKIKWFCHERRSLSFCWKFHLILCKNIVITIYDFWNQ